MQSRQPTNARAHEVAEGYLACVYEILAVAEIVKEAKRLRQLSDTERTNVTPIRIQTTRPNFAPQLKPLAKVVFENINHELTSASRRAFRKMEMRRTPNELVLMSEVELEAIPVRGSRVLAELANEALEAITPRLISGLSQRTMFGNARKLERLQLALASLGDETLAVPSIVRKSAEEIHKVVGPMREVNPAAAIEPGDDAAPTWRSTPEEREAITSHEEKLAAFDALLGL